MDTHIEIKNDGSAISTLKLNGIDISLEASRVEFIHEGGKLPEVKLTFVGNNVSIDTMLLDNPTTTAKSKESISESKK